MMETISPAEFAETVADLPFVSVDTGAVEDYFEMELTKAKTGRRATEPYLFVQVLKQEAGLECGDDWMSTIIASIYEHHIKTARQRVGGGG